MKSTHQAFAERIAVVGFPDSCERYHSHAPAQWTRESLGRLKDLGFTRIQLNLA